jgi:stearoyl-CoA desaturase (delta-9 desaturase)
MYAGIRRLALVGYVLITLGLTHVTIAAVTIFLHRHQAHRALDLHPLVRISFAVAVADDRHGHQGMGGDPSQASRQVRNRRGPAQSAGVRHPPGPVDGRLSVRQGGQKPLTLQRYGHGTPDDWIENHLYSPWHKLGVVIMLAIDMAVFGVLAGPLIWAVQMAWIPFWAAGVINGLGHFWGYRNFSPKTPAPTSPPGAS